MKTDEKPRKTMKNYEKPRKTMKNYEKLWKTMKTMKNNAGDAKSLFKDEATFPDLILTSNIFKHFHIFSYIL